MKFFAIQYLLVAIWPNIPDAIPTVTASQWSTELACLNHKADLLKIPGVNVVVDCKFTNGTERIIINAEEMR